MRCVTKFGPGAGTIRIYTVFQKKHVTFLMISDVELSVYKDFWHTYYQEYRPSTGVFILPPYLFSAATLPWEIVKT